MGSPCPPHWTFAARAAYFGDRMCAFCGHRNPAGAKFCNDCASPLHLKPCKQCDAVNDQAATNCYQCGAAYPVSFSTAEATSMLPGADSALAWKTPGDIAFGAAVSQPLFAMSVSRVRWPLLRPGQFLVAAIATIVIVSAYEAYHDNVATPDAMGVASQPIAESNATPARPAAQVAAESKPVEPERSVALRAPIPAADDETPKRASVRQRTVPVPATKRASAHQRPVPKRQPTGNATVAHGLAAARVQTGKPPGRTNQWQVMQVSLALCSGDLIARFACDLRVRQRFCEGHWGETPECANGVASEHAQ